MTQCQRILQFIDEHGSITTMQAYRIGITRLPARVHDMRQSGIKISGERISGKNEYGSYSCMKYSKAV